MSGQPIDTRAALLADLETEMADMRASDPRAGRRRGQLTVYFRLLDVPRPTPYGATADESM